ncbi:MAG: YggS family pyridoxal phosphate-dependent enzyme [Gammaproteobacteria bacterium]
MISIADRLAYLNSDIRHAEYAAGRSPHSVQLLAVSKTKSAADIAAAYQAGQRHFGESYVQEALSKQHLLAHYNITWHFIGPLQSNKTKAIARQFTWVHSVDRLKLAQRLSEQRPAFLPPLNVCVQVNVSGEDSKSGIALEELPHLIEAVKVLPRLRLRGVMAVPAPEHDYEKQRLPYRLLYQFVRQLRLPELDTYSFGMTDDMQAAIAEGSTLVRIGTALFGAREYA